MQKQSKTDRPSATFQ